MPSAFDAEPCRCPAPNRECRRAGVPMLGHLWQRCRDRDDFRRLFDGLPQRHEEPARLELACLHRGESTAVIECPSCSQDLHGNAKTRVKVFACAKHGRCTIGKRVENLACCLRCKDWEAAPLPYGGPVVRNLLCHVYPLRGGVWRWHAAELRKRLGLFNGRKVVAVALGSETDPAEAVQEALGDGVHDWVILPNDSGLREVASFEALWSRVETRSPREITYYCQGKGVRYPDSPAVRSWCAAMYETVFDRPDLVDRALERHVFAGSFRRLGRFFEGQGSPSRWHYSGTFFAARSARVFARDWRRIDRQWFGVEAWPGLLAHVSESACLFGDNAGDLYHADAWDRQVTPALIEWRKACPTP